MTLATALLVSSVPLLLPFLNHLQLLPNCKSIKKKRRATFIKTDAEKTKGGKVNQAWSWMEYVHWEREGMRAV